MTEITYKPIGIIHSPYRSIDDMPIQPCGAEGIRGTVEIFKNWVPGLNDLAGFSHIFLLYHFHKAGKPSLQVTPFLDSQSRGVFATRSPNHPNPVGLSVVQLIDVQKEMITVEGVDILDGTPLLDIKPYVPKFDHHPPIKTGWLEKAARNAERKRSDRRFR